VSAIDPFDPSGEQPTENNGLIELENVTFAYPTRPNVTVLDNFSLKAPAGKVTALVVRKLPITPLPTVVPAGKSLTFSSP